MNIKFCPDMFSQQTSSNMLYSTSCERRKYVEKSQEALYQVRKKLESLHNVLRMYELQSIETKPLEKQQDSGNKINSVCQNVVDTLVSITTEGDNSWNKNRREFMHFNSDTRNECKEIQQTTSNSSEQYESDETGRSSIISIQNYTYCVNNIIDPYCSLMENTDLKIPVSTSHALGMIPNNQIVYSSVKYEKVPERIYYAISTDSITGKDVRKKSAMSENFALLPNVYAQGEQTKSFSSSEQYPVPMETDEDAIMSPTSSRTEVSKDSEFEDKPTAVLLQEALQFKRALLTRVELEKVCYADEKTEEGGNDSTLDHGKYSYFNNNLQSKFLDIISEEQSVSSSTEKTSRTYMFFNLKQDKQINNNILNLPQQTDVRELNTQKSYMDSVHNLGSPSEYFSFSNIIQEGNEIDNNQVSLLSHSFQKNTSAELINTFDESNEKLMKFASCLNTTDVTNDEETCHSYVHEKESFKEHFARMNDINQFINRNINSVELFSQNLDEAPLEEKAESSNENISSNFFNSESLKQYGNASTTYAEDNTSSVKLNVSDDDKCIEDRENFMCNPNLTLKRNPGACSLIEQTLVHTNIDDMILNEHPIYNLSPSESKETSVETNMLQDSLTSSINQSNDSNMLESPSVTILINKSLNEEKLNLDWSNANNDMSDYDVNEQEVKTCSANTITLQKHDTTNIDNYEETNIHYIQNEQKYSIAKDSFTNLTKEEIVNEADYRKSYSNLISPHSSMYFTDEASSSTPKLNNTHSKNLKDYLHSNLYTQSNRGDKSCYEDKSLKNTGNIEAPSIFISNESKTMNVTTTIPTDKSSIIVSKSKSNNTQNAIELYNKVWNENDSFSSKVCTEKTDTTIASETNDAKKQNEILNDKSSISYNDDGNYNTTDNTIPYKYERSGMKNLNVKEYIIAPHQTSPRETKENKVMKKITTVKSKSHENYSSKSEKLRRASVLQNIKCLKSDLLATAQNNTENNTNTIYTKLRNLSAEPRRNAKDNIKLDKKRSRSEVSCRINDLLKEDTLKSQEPLAATNSNISIEPLETKLKSKGILKSLSSTPKTSSRSCIPILKSRLEAARKSDNESRPKSPTRGPLTMTMFWRDNLCDKNQNIMDDVQVEGKSKCIEPCIEEVNICGEKKSDNDSHKQHSTQMSHVVKNINENTNCNMNDDIVPQEQMVVYVNIFTKYDHNTTKIIDPNKFLEYIQNRKSSSQKKEENQASKNDREPPGVSAGIEKDITHKIVTVVSSVINGNELNQTTSTNLPDMKTQSRSLFNILSNGKLKNLCFLSVEQKEIDVTAKPSVIDTSTSISDLENITGTSKNALDKFQICGTPRELNNDEYIALLEILHQESNYVHLQELQSVCKELVSEHRKI
ncbi:uncharacterized protein LOC143424405 [Xylocopa sonorina]|uniref:uncharacterized protein LOC143424405 n=1 Tax=Xylocopa sonorina TaxID=1818115 RepID=UPI00403AA0F5